MKAPDPIIGDPAPLRMLLFGLAIGIGILVEAIVAIASGSAGYLLSNLSDEFGPVLFNVLIDGAPFLFLAARGVTARTPWTIGIVLVAVVWGYVAIKFVTGGFAGGTSVGNSLWLAAVSIGSSFVITLICWLVSRHRPALG